MHFIDEAEIIVRAGKGGDGAVSFRREPYVPKGGPNGGQGGRGGDVIFRATVQLSTLEDITLKRVYKANDGKPGEGDNMTGKSAKDLIIDIPAGTLIWDVDTDSLAADLSEEGETFLAAKGGRGGKGNSSFATSRNQAPRKYERGKPGEERKVRLELKLIADVGIVGRPNAGKSTLLSALSRATPKVAAYPFTTLSPVLGVVPVGAYDRFIMADIPGLAEGAAQGRGLGHRFLRHIERTRLILMLIEATENDYMEAYNSLVSELESFNEDLATLPRILVLSKVDLLTKKRITGKLKFDLKISGLHGDGLEELVKLISGKLGIKPIYF